VVALSQLSRASERRGDDKRPMLSDLRESGQLSRTRTCGVHSPRVVLQPHRRAFRGREGEVEIILAKQRNGPTGTVNLNFVSRFTRFDDPDTTHAV